MTWEKVKLEDVCSKITSGGTPKSTNLLFYYPEEIPWLKTKEVNYSRIYNTETYISKEGLKHSSAKIIPVNSVIVAMYGQGDTAGRVAINKIPLCTNQACCNLIINSDIADYEYVYYVLVTLYEKFVSLKNGGAQPNLNVAIIKSIEIPLPTLEMQHKISSILSAYDDLIENTQKQIKLLEEAAQRLYKEWFVDLHFPGYETTPIIDGVPKGWEKEFLTNLVDVQYGYAFNGAFFNNTGCGMPIVRIRNIPEGQTMDFTTEEASKEYIIHNGDILVGMDGDFHINTWGGKDAYLVQRTCSLRPKFNYMKGYLLQAIVEPIKYFEKTVVGATVAHLGKKHIDTIKIFKAPVELYRPFQIWYEKRQSLINQNRLLVEARDRLLPKLMNGELEV